MRLGSWGREQAPGTFESRRVVAAAVMQSNTFLSMTLLKLDFSSRYRHPILAAGACPWPGLSPPLHEVPSFGTRRC